MTVPAFVLPRLSEACAARPRRRVAIGLTPLIDVVFILLVFFMLASSFVDRRAIDVAPPVATLGGFSAEGALLIELRGDEIRFAGRVLPLAELASRLKTQASHNRMRRVLIKPAGGVSLQQAVDLLDLVVATGLTNVSFVPVPSR